MEDLTKGSDGLSTEVQFDPGEGFIRLRIGSPEDRFYANAETSTFVGRLIFESCQAHNCLLILVEVYPGNRPNIIFEQDVVARARARGYNAEHRIAVVDSNPNTLAGPRFMENMFLLGGFPIFRHFTDIHSATSWLRGGFAKDVGQQSSAD